MLHFTTRADWGAPRHGGEYRPSSLDDDGFIHLSFGHQVTRVATEVAHGRNDLILLVVDPSALKADIRLEQGFPHLYRPIPIDSIQLAVDFVPDDDGSFRLPEEARLTALALLAAPSPAAALERAKSVMAGFVAPWWVGGGWAVDAASSSVSRPHLDIDIVVLRRDVPALGEGLADWDMRIARDGALPIWLGGELAGSDHQLWARPGDGFRPERWQDFAADPGFVEFLAEDLDSAGNWAYGRDAAVRAPLARPGPSGGFIRSEVALLYKAAAAIGNDRIQGAKAQGDFDHALPHLDRDQREWLAEALDLSSRGHPWISRLAAESVA